MKNKTKRSASNFVCAAIPRYDWFVVGDVGLTSKKTNPIRVTKLKTETLESLPFLFFPPFMGSWMVSGYFQLW